MLVGQEESSSDCVFQQIKNDYFDNGLKEHLSDDYYFAGIVIGTQCPSEWEYS